MLSNRWAALSPQARSDLGAGIMFLLVGSFAAIYGLLSYRMGAVDRMGPGFFPVMVGFAVAGMGLIVTVMAARNTTPAGTDDPAADGGNGIVELAVVTAAVVAFALFLNTLGLFVAIAGMTLIARLTRRGSWKELALLAIALSVIAYAIFVIGLRMPFKLAPF